MKMLTARQLREIERWCKERAATGTQKAMAARIGVKINTVQYWVRKLTRSHG